MMRRTSASLAFSLCWFVLAACEGPRASDGAREAHIRHTVATDPVSEDPDDPAVWVNRVDPAASLIIGTNKVAAPSGSLVVFGLDGKTRQTISGIDRPNNVDVEYDVPVGGRAMDIAVVTERLRRRLRVFAISASGLRDVSSSGGIPVFDGQPDEAGAPMGIALYRRPRDGAVFAIVSRKTGPRQGYLWQYRLSDDGAGGVAGVKVREFGGFSGKGEIEAVAVDDELGFVYYADEGDGIHKWHADPNHPEAGRELAHFGKSGFQADREGIAIYARTGAGGYVVCTDQLEADSRYLVYRREGSGGNPHDHGEPIAVLRGGADSTDGLEIVSTPLGPAFPNGIMVAMNSKDRNFLLYRWEAAMETPGR